MIWFERARNGVLSIFDFVFLYLVFLGLRDLAGVLECRAGVGIWCSRVWAFSWFLLGVFYSFD